MNNRKTEMTVNTNEIGAFELFQLESFTVEEIKEKLPSLLNENGDNIDIEKTLMVFLSILKDTSLTAKGNQHGLASIRR